MARRESTWMRLGVVLVVVAAGCGRIGFDMVDATGDGAGGDDLGSDGMFGDGPPAVSCGTLASTCGPTGTSPCCESPVVSGGTYARSYDVSGDGMYPDMSFGATVSDFRLDKYEVTVGRFRQFVAAGTGTQQSPPAVGAGGRTLNGMANQGGWEASFTGSLAADTTALVGDVKCDPTYETWTDAPGGNENRPMNCMTWYAAMAFCLWDGGFLPTETEWNYAASGGSLQRAHPWSSPPSSLTLDDSTYASYYVNATMQCFGDGVNGCARTDLVPVGTKPAGDGVWGQSDLSGNVWEWTLDWYASPYPMTTCNDCANLTTASDRVLRGGSFNDAASYLRGADRNVGAPSDRSYDRGVRCARTP